MQKTKLASAMLICFLFSGCSLSDAGNKLKVIDQKIGEGLNNFQEGKIEDLLDLPDGEKVEQATTTIKIDPKNLTLEQERKIDLWLKERDLNRYGDPAGTFYPGGTPLFDEITRLSIERYDYIIRNHPEVIEYLQTE